MLETPLRVSILCESPAQRLHLQHLLSHNGITVETSSDFSNFSVADSHADVLLVDVYQAHEKTFTNLEHLLNQSDKPILFNDGLKIPVVDNASRGDAYFSFLEKLMDLVNRPNSMNMDRPVVIPNRNLNIKAYQRVLAGKKPAASKTQTTDSPQTKHETRLSIIAYSKTRRTTLARLLKSFSNIKTIALDSKFDLDQALSEADVILLDSHNVGPSEQGFYDAIQGQISVPCYICNSSEIPADPATRKVWAQTLSDELLESSQTAANVQFDPDATLDDIFNDIFDDDTFDDNPFEIFQNETASKDETNTVAELEEVFSEIEEDVEQRRQHAILNDLPMQSFDEVENSNPIVTAKEFEFDYSNMESYSEQRIAEVLAEAENDENIQPPSKVETANYAKVKPAREDQKFTSLADLFIDELEQKENADNPFGNQHTGKSGTLKTWFSNITSRLQRKKRKAG